MARLDILLSGYDITDEVINRSSSSSLKLDHDTIRGTADIEIWTGAGGTGTQLALTTDYTVAGEDTRISTAVGGGISVYTTLAIVNGAYHSTDLYVTYKTVGDYASVSSSRLIQIGYKEITGDYTVTANDRTIIVNTASAVTITLPEGLPIGSDVLISRIVASTNAVTVARSGSETIEGGASFVVIGDKVSSELDPSEITIKKTSSSSWMFVGGTVKGSNTNGKYIKYPNRILHQEYLDSADSSCSDGPIGALYYRILPDITFPIPFKTGTVPQVTPKSYDTGSGLYWPSVQGIPTATKFNFEVVGTSNDLFRMAYIADGEW